MKNVDCEPTGRRDFLKLAMALGPAAAAVAATGAQATEVDSVAPVMQDTPHVRAYYESARF